jgi:ABC-2 type transport system ATP-binding protein/lipopolysaccharide transport system ATP-binding protein
MWTFVMPDLHSVLNNNAVIFDDVSVSYRVPKEKLSGIKEFAIRWIQRRLQYDQFWALQEINFQVERGEVFGVIGRNGAGKSTLLKIIARILQPTRGRMISRGRIAPFLELGAGFHPELTGRENIFLNGALLGFSRKEITTHLAEMINFAGIGDFIDAPLRTYSTGMIARLGFSVATTIRPDILLIDEVLSVGDASFQEKCIERMNFFRDKGTTIVFVTHDMNVVKSFCERAIWIDYGKLQAIGEARMVVQEYLTLGNQ